MWLSVHEQIFGAKSRKLAKKLKCSQNEAVGLVMRLWMWAISDGNAQRNGYLEGCDKEDIAEILNVGNNKKIDPDEVVRILIEDNWIECREDGLYIHDWEEWQASWYDAVERKQRDKERKRRKRAEKREQELEKEKQQKAEKEIKKEDTKETKDIKEIEEVKEVKETPKNGKGYSSTFEDFWSVYPRKIGKGDVYKKYKARIKDGWSPDELKEAAQNYAEQCEIEHTEKQYIKYGKSFLSDSTPFTDYLGSSKVLAEEKAGMKQQQIKSQKDNGIHNFTQRDYDFDDLEQQILKKQFESS